MPNIHPLTLADRSLVLDYLRSNPPEISEFTFTNLFIWQPSRPVFFAVLDDSLVFLVEAAEKKGKYILFGPPAGTIPIGEIFSAFGDQVIGAARIPDEYSRNISPAEFTVTEDRDNGDYVYRVADLAELAGRRYAKKRNHIKQCLSSYKCEYVPITADNIVECEAMQEKWCRHRECGRNPGLCNEANAVAEAFAHFIDFNLLGGAIRVDGTIQAFAIGEELHSGTAVWHFEKAMGDIPGLGQVINQWFSKYGLGGFEYVNREQDLGIKGIRQAKKSYYPHHMVPKNYVFPAGAQPVNALSIKAEGCAAHEY
jgi:hypothetical protein